MQLTTCIVKSCKIKEIIHCLVPYILLPPSIPLFGGTEGKYLVVNQNILLLET